MISKSESDLLYRVTYCIPVELQTRFNQLVKKRQATTITELELQELCDLNDRIELLEAERIQDLAQLAQLRSVSLPELMKQLNLSPVNHG
jgi:pantothenate kinase